MLIAALNQVPAPQDGDNDPYWGSAFIRERQGPDGIFATVNNFNRDARATSDLGFMWA